MTRELSDRVRGVIFGTAVGDALGYPVEFDPKPHVKNYHLVDNPNYDGKGIHAQIALYSDDTQMMVATFEGLLRARGGSVDQVAEEVAEAYVAWSISPENNRAPGNACMHGCRKLAENVPWRESGKLGAKGCGTAMRSMAYGVAYFHDTTTAAKMAASHALMTHRSTSAQASAAGVAAGVAAAITKPHPGAVVKAVMQATNQYDRETSEMVAQAVADAHDGVLPEAVLDRWRGWVGSEALAASLYCFLRHPDSYSGAVLEAVNSPGDSDSLGAITGAFAGGRLGAIAINPVWLHHIENGGMLEVLHARVMKAIRENLESDPED